jgi:hypothetical protein
MTGKIAVKRGSGNVFADLSLDHPEEEKLKAQLVREIRDIIKRRRLPRSRLRPCWVSSSPMYLRFQPDAFTSSHWSASCVVSVAWTGTWPLWCGRSGFEDQCRHVGPALPPDLLNSRTRSGKAGTGSEKIMFKQTDEMTGLRRAQFSMRALPKSWVARRYQNLKAIPTSPAASKSSPARRG